MNTANFISNSPITTNIFTNAAGNITISTSQSTTYGPVFLMLLVLIVFGIGTLLWTIFTRKNDSESD
jgi:hypothetical protein